MIFKDWQESFDAFCVEFDDYLRVFPQVGRHVRYVETWRKISPLIRDGNRSNQPGAPFFEVHCAVMLLLDGRRSLTPEQRKLRPALLFRWRQLERSANASPLGDGHRVQYPKGTYDIG